MELYSVHKSEDERWLVTAPISDDTKRKMERFETVEEAITSKDFDDLKTRCFWTIQNALGQNRKVGMNR